MICKKYIVFILYMDTSKFKVYVPKNIDRSVTHVKSKPIGPKMYMIRHLERVDDAENRRTEQYKLWKSVENDYNYKINPFLNDVSSNKYLEKLTESLSDELDEQKIDYVICSPFTRCIETAILVSNGLSDKVTNKTIHIDYKLSEIIHHANHFEYPLKIDDVYNFSLRYICDKYPLDVKRLVVDEETKKLEFYNDEKDIGELDSEEYTIDGEYIKRISDEIKIIRAKYSGNILVVTHADAIKISSGIKRMEYGKFYEINESLIGGNIMYREKYLKYKAKYLNLKKKLNIVI